MCWGKAKRQTEQKQAQGQKTPGRVFYWTGNNPNLLCSFLGEVIQKGLTSLARYFVVKFTFLSRKMKKITSDTKGSTTK